MITETDNDRDTAQIRLKRHLASDKVTRSIYDSAKWTRAHADLTLNSHCHGRHKPWTGGPYRGREG